MRKTRCSSYRTVEYNFDEKGGEFLEYMQRDATLKVECKQQVKSTFILETVERDWFDYPMEAKCYGLIKFIELNLYLLVVPAVPVTEEVGCKDNSICYKHNSVKILDPIELLYFTDCECSFQRAGTAPQSSSMSVVFR
ncbi:hypothetical protein STEG23_015785 [Scotinomys teguina]